jgi:hypothetical protein
MYTKSHFHTDHLLLLLPTLILPIKCIKKWKEITNRIKCSSSIGIKDDFYCPPLILLLYERDEIWEYRMIGSFHISSMMMMIKIIINSLFISLPRFARTQFAGESKQIYWMRSC